MEGKFGRLRRLAGIGVAVGAMVAVTACGGSDSSSGGSGASDSGGNSGKKAKVALALPGPNAYFQPWELAAKDAGAKYGFEATFAVPASDAFNLTQQNALVDSLAAKGYNGFGFFPGDAHGTNAEQKKLESRGIKSVNINGCTYDPSPALFCVSTNVYEAAKYQAEQLIEAIGGKGDIAVLTSQLTDPNTQLRIKAVKEVAAATGGKVKLAQIVADIDTPQSAPPAINALLAARGKTLAGVMSTSYNPSVAFATAVTDSPEYRRIKFLGAENSPQVMNALKKGYITGTLFQNTYGQAYVAAYALYKAIEKGCTVKADAPFDATEQTKRLITAGVLVVDKSNLAEYDGKPESLPADTDKMIKLLDEKVLSC
jgi:ribose transport system substrate-binding protein